MGLSGSVAESHADLLEKAAWYRGFENLEGAGGEGGGRGDRDGEHM